MARIRRTVRYLLIAAAAGVVVLVALFWVLTGTEWGAERAGRLAVERLQEGVNGELHVGRITSRALLRGVVLHDVSITDPDGRRFLRADSARLGYHLRTLLGGDIAIDRLVLHAPDIHLERLPGQDGWNFQRIFPPDPETVPDPPPARDLVLISHATVFDGRVTVRLPWEPAAAVQPDDTARLILETVPGGIARVVRFEDVNGRFPRIAWRTPDQEGTAIRIDRLETRAFIWDTPAEIRRLEGTVTIRDSLIAFDLPSVRLPASELAVAGRMILGVGEDVYDIEADGREVALRDFQWLYPPLPDEGGGSLRFRIQTLKPGETLWLTRDARLRVGRSDLTGSFGVVTGDTLYFSNVDLRASPLDLELVQRLVPGDLPVEGLLIGTVEMDGPLSALRTRGDLRYQRWANGTTTESGVRWTGIVRAVEPYGVRSLFADVRRLDLDQLTALLPELRLQGIATGRIRADGSPRHGLRLEGDADLDHGGVRSAVRGAGQLTTGGERSTFDLRLDAEPLALDRLGARFPALARLTGEARGPIRVTGSLADMHVDLDLVTPAGGLVLNGRFALDTAVPRYRAAGAVTDFRLDRLVDGMPETLIAARFDLDGAGTGLEDLDARLAVDVFSAVLPGLVVHNAALRASTIEGLARVDSLSVSAGVGELRARGTLGLVTERDGELLVSLLIDSLHSLEPLVFPEPFANGLDDLERELPRLAGVVRADGSIHGSIRRWSADGTVDVRDAIYGDVTAARADLRFQWSNTTLGRLVLSGGVDSLTAGHRVLRSARTRLHYDGTGGEVELVAVGPADERADLAGSFRRDAERTWFEVERFDLTTPGGVWLLADAAQGTFGRRGLIVEPLVLARALDGARLEVAGALPWRQEGNAGTTDAAFDVRADNVPIGEIVRLSQARTAMDGLVTGHVAVTGTALSPVMEARLHARDFRYHDAVLDSAALDLAYRQRQVAGDLTGWRGARRIVRANGQVPLDLALAQREDRRLDHPMQVDLRVDSVPVSLVAFLVPGMREMGGTLHGEVDITGTPVRPAFGGELRLVNGTGLFEHSAVRYRRVEAVARIRENAVLDLEGTFRTDSGSGEVRGRLDLADPADPGFDLDLVARRLDASRRQDVAAIVEGRARLTGRYRAPVISGDLRILQGQMNLDEILRQYQIIRLEPWFFEVFDTATVGFRPVQRSPFLDNLRVSDATIRVDRDFWLRGSELNVEVTGTVGLSYERATDDLRMTGALQAVRGTYALQVVQGIAARRFDIRGGTIEFPGTPGLDPNLDILAQHRVRRAQGDPIDVLGRVSGTLQSPRVHLSSDTEPPISESDLVSYLVFGRSSLELTQAEADVVSTQVGQGVRQLGRGVWGFGLPTLYSLASTGLHSMAISSGVPILRDLDYLALTAPDHGLAEYRDPTTFIREAQLEGGLYATRDLFVLGTVRIPAAGQGVGNQFERPRLGLRLEYRFWPTWIAEAFWEDRFARTPAFGLQEIEDRTVLGLSVSREWGY